jgi:hypothetical protein
MFIGVVTVSGTNILHKIERRTPVEENSARGNVSPKYDAYTYRISLRKRESANIYTSRGGNRTECD